MESPRYRVLQLFLEEDLQTKNPVVEMESPRYRVLQHFISTICGMNSFCRNGKPERVQKRIFKQQEMPTITEQFQFSGCWHFFQLYVVTKKQ
mgnify:CR=1 FL=1